MTLFLSLLCIVSALPLLFTGCHSRGDRPLSLTLATGKDPSGAIYDLIGTFEASHPGIRVRLQEMPWSTDAQHNQCAIQLMAEDPSVDIYSIDVIWPAEFAQAKWALPLNGYFPREEQEKFLPGTIQACTYQGSVYAVPWTTDAGMLYYRKDLIQDPPETWEDLVTLAGELQTQGKVWQIVFPADQYEGMICAFMEFLWANGGDVFSPEGKVVLDSQKAVQALDFMVSLIREKRLTPPGITTYKEEDCRVAFQTGKALFMRNWPYCWQILNKASEGSVVAGKVGVAPLPVFASSIHSARKSHPSPGPAGSAPAATSQGLLPGGEGTCTLGGWNLMISRFSRYPQQAWQLVQFLTSYQMQKMYSLISSQIPTRKALYQDPELIRKYPHFKDFYPVFLAARPRPVSPFYSKVSSIMQIHVHKALTGQASPREALQAAAREINSIEGLHERDDSGKKGEGVPGSGGGDE